MPAVITRRLTFALLLLAALALAWALGHQAFAPVLHWAMHYHGGPSGVAMHFHGIVAGSLMHYFG